MDAISDRKRSLLYDQLKIITILLVVLGHCFIMFSPESAIPVQRGSVILSYAAKILYRFHIPCFFMASGAVFAYNLRKGKYEVFADFVKAKARRLLIPYGIFGVLIVLPTLLICGLLEPSRWYTFFWNLINGIDIRHLWYLYDLFAMFLLFWFFRKRVPGENPKKVLAVSFAVSIVFRSLPFEFISYFQIGNIFYYQFFFLWGIFFDRYFYRLLAVFKKRRFLPFLCGLLLIMSCFADLYTLSGYVYAAAGVALTVMAAQVLCGRKKWIENQWWNRVIGDSYGIYLFHPMIMYLIFYGFSRWEVPVIFLLLLSLTVSFGLSFLLTEVCRKARLSFVIGEKGKRS